MNRKRQGFSGCVAVKEDSAVSSTLFSWAHSSFLFAFVLPLFVLALALLHDAASRFCLRRFPQRSPGGKIRTYFFQYARSCIARCQRCDYIGREGELLHQSSLVEQGQLICRCSGVDCRRPGSSGCVSIRDVSYWRFLFGKFAFGFFLFRHLSWPTLSWESLLFLNDLSLSSEFCGGAFVGNTEQDSPVGSTCFRASGLQALCQLKVFLPEQANSSISLSVCQDVHASVRPNTPLRELEVPAVPLRNNLPPLDVRIFSSAVIPDTRLAGLSLVPPLWRAVLGNEFLC